MNHKYIGIMWALLALVLTIVCLHQRETIEKQSRNNNRLSVSCGKIANENRLA